jgi:ElaB/YqjD/DUF883 family membrane-anchored ribosome-binding protein
MKTAAELDRVVGDLKTLGQGADRLVKATAVDTKDGLFEARARLEKAVASARRTCERTEERLRRGIKATDEGVRRHPYGSMGAAFGAGLLIGALTMWWRR